MTRQHHEQTLSDANRKGFEQSQATTPPTPPTTTSNVMRHEYRELTEAEKVNMIIIRDLGRLFVEKCDELGESRELALAKTKIEEAVFWACKHITR